MKNSKSVILATVAVVVVAAVIAAVALGGEHDKSADTSMAPMNMSNSSNKPASASAAVATTKVGIQNYSFNPEVIKVKVGDTVTWTNHDSVEHTVTSDDGSTDSPSSQLLATGATYSFTFKKTGTYTYHCTPHPYMKGTVVVE